MSGIVISGASGNLGRKITTEVLARLPAKQLTLTTRTPDRLADLAARGVRVQAASYRDPAARESAYQGADTLMLISGLDVTHRVPEHRNAIEAARRAGIRHIVYTSTAGIHPRNPTLSASDHIVTEADLRACGLGYTILRDATYAEVFPTVAAAPALRTGKFHHVKGSGRLAPISRRDIARCAARCLLDPGYHNGATYEITGPDLLTFRQIVALMSKNFGVPIEYVECTPEERYAQLDAMGVPRTYSEGMATHADAHLWCSEEMVTAELAYEQGFHAILTDHVELITGRTAQSLQEVFDCCRGLDFNDT